MKAVAAGIADLGTLTRIESECFGDDAWSPSLVEAELSADTRSVILATDESSVVGYGSIMVVDDVADLQRIAILPGARRRGLGRELLEELLVKAAELGATRMILEVSATNTAAIALYESFGFSVIHQRRDYYSDGADALVMEKVESS